MYEVLAAFTPNTPPYLENTHLKFISDDHIGMSCALVDKADNTVHNP